MLIELAVRDLGVIGHLSLVLPSGMVAVTGETGAGKTLVVTAIDLLTGGRADPTMVRPGASEAVVEGRFALDDEEVVLRRVVPADGRSRAYIDGDLATAATLREVGGRLVDLHGQHTHQSLLATRVQRDALDQFASVDLSVLAEARGRVAALDAELASLGGDDRERARESDLLRYQLDELEAVGLESGEDESLDAEGELLAGAEAHQAAAATASALVSGGEEGDSGAADALGRALGEIIDRGPFAELEARLRGLIDEVGEIGRDLRRLSEEIEADPQRLSEVRLRQDLIGELKRKYGESTGEILAFGARAAEQLEELATREERAGQIDVELRAARDDLEAAEARVGSERRKGAPGLAAEATSHLADLALPEGRVEVTVADRDPGEDVSFLFTANVGSPLLPLAKVASGGELARIMLALRLVLTAGPDVLVFDEVDAGVGGTTALAVGRSLAAVGASHQVLVVTHLAQVAAFAHGQVEVSKTTVAGTTQTTARVLADEERVVELSRMLSGSPESQRAHEHAIELLEAAAAERSI